MDQMEARYPKGIKEGKALVEVWSVVQQVLLVYMHLLLHQLNHQ